MTVEDPARWLQVRELFEVAADLPEDERAALLRVRTGEDSDLRRRVEALLAADASSSSVLDEPVFIPAEGDGDLIGRRIGVHRVEKEIGRGGMGGIYLAVRDDGEYRERVAVKVIHRGIVNPDTRERFRRERQILADLDHPNIARLLGGGVTEDGRPYFVMEYIDGLPIDRYCADTRLGTGARIALMRTVCEAVQAAHRRLVVHCDLKPGNILVTADGTPKLLDFGIARLLDLQPGAVPLTVTASRRPLTPGYASPEQIRGRPISTASDIFSLGVVLYELLTGRSPFTPSGRDLYEIDRAICEDDPLRPSEAASQRARTDTAPGRLRRELAGDLDNIVLRALAKEPDGRYGSAEQLGEDLRRHVEGIPVRARPATWTYRAGRFLKRHAMAVLATVLVLASLIVGVAVASYQARLAEIRGVTAERTLAFLIDLFEESDPDEAGDGTRTLLDVLDKGAEKIESELRDEPLARATLLNTIGEVYRELGRFDRAAPLLTEAYEIRLASFTDPHPDLAESRLRLGLLHLRTGDHATAESFLTAALETNRQLFGEEHVEVADGLGSLALLRRAQGRYDSAESLSRRALEIFRHLHGEKHADVARAMNNLGVVLRQRENYDEAEALFLRALEIRREVLGEEHPRVAYSLNNLALLRRSQQDLDGAEALYRESLDMQRRLLGEHPQVATTLGNLAVLSLSRGQPGPAKALLEEALALQERHLDADHPRLANTRTQLALLHFHGGDLESAERLWRDGVAAMQARLGATHPEVVNARKNLSVVLRRRGKLVDAEAVLSQTLGDLEGMEASEPGALASILVQLGRVLLDQNRPADAEAPLRRCLDVRQALPEEKAEAARCRVLFGASLAAQGRFEEAEAPLREGHKILRQERGDEHSWTLDARKQLQQFGF